MTLSTTCQYTDTPNTTQEVVLQLEEVTLLSPPCRWCSGTSVWQQPTFDGGASLSRERLSDVSL